MINRERELRRCIVDNIGDCFFHCWENYSEPIPAGVTIGSHPAGILSFVRGVVEDENGQIYCVNANKIRFLTDKEILDLHKKHIIESFKTTHNSTARLLIIIPFIYLCKFKYPRSGEE